MLTQCPECQTMFRVTAAMLKAAQGRVRCGRCNQVFNALASLIEQDEPEDDKAPANGDLPHDPDEFESVDIPESALEFTADDLSKVFVVQAPPPPKPAVSDEDTAEHELLDIELETPEPPEVITLEGDSVILGETDPSVSDEYFLEDEQEKEETERDKGDADPAPAPGVASAQPASPTPHTKVRSIDIADDEVRREIEAAFAADPTTRAEFTLPSGKRLEIGRGVTTARDDSEAGEQLVAANERRLRVVHGWSIASGVLAVTLVLQLMHHNRQSLVRNGVIGGAVASIYAGLGSELSPEWNVHAYELRQFGAAADANAGGTLRVRASLMNGATHAQPYPLLRLTLQDRFGGQVGLRDLEPREYLPSVPGRNALIGAGQRIDADIAIVDPGKDAVGFEIDVCLRASPTQITCAGDASRGSG